MATVIGSSINDVLLAGCRDVVEMCVRAGIFYLRNFSFGAIVLLATGEFIEVLFPAQFIINLAKANQVRRNHTNNCYGESEEVKLATCSVLFGKTLLKRSHLVFISFHLLFVFLLNGLQLQCNAHPTILNTNHSYI